MSGSIRAAIQERALSNRDIPPTRTIEPIDAPPDSANPTTAMLKADINSGRTGDKVEVYDPGLSACFCGAGVVVPAGCAGWFGLHLAPAAP